MESSQAEYLRRCIRDNLADNNENRGRLKWVDIQRLFREYFGSEQELRRFLEEECRGKPMDRADDLVYVFRDIARKWGEIMKEELRTKKREAEKVRGGIRNRNGLVEIMEDVSSLWKSGWDKTLKDPNLRANITNYITSFWRMPQVKLGLEIAAEANRLTTVENEIAELEREMAESYSE